MNPDDLELKRTFSTVRCTALIILMNDFMAKEFGLRETSITFVHSFLGHASLYLLCLMWPHSYIKRVTKLIAIQRFNPLKVSCGCLIIQGSLLDLS